MYISRTSPYKQSENTVRVSIRVRVKVRVRIRVGLRRRVQKE